MDVIRGERNYARALWLLACGILLSIAIWAATAVSPIQPLGSSGPVGSDQAQAAGITVSNHSKKEVTFDVSHL